MALTDAQTRALDALDEDEVIATLVDLVRVPSVTGTDAESELQHRQAALFETEGLEVDTWQLDLEALRADPRFPGTEADRSEGYGLVGTTGGDGPAGLVLQGHVDVVPIGDATKWEHDPFAARIAAGRLHGRGACDMKAGVAPTSQSSGPCGAAGSPSRSPSQSTASSARRTAVSEPLRRCCAAMAGRWRSSPNRRPADSSPRRPER